mgnify:FL=1
MKNIVLCGSTKVKEDILKIKEKLEDKGYHVLLPEECLKDIPKKIASRTHFSRIENKNNQIVLIVNTTKNGIENYIGPNSFAEIAFAFYFNKNIFLLNDYYEPYLDELTAWNVTPLKGNLNNIKKEL